MNRTIKISKIKIVRYTNQPNSFPPKSINKNERQALEKHEEVVKCERSEAFVVNNILGVASKISVNGSYSTDFVSSFRRGYCGNILKLSAIRRS